MNYPSKTERILADNPGLWDPNKTLKQNAEAFKMSIMSAYRMSYIHNLQYARIYHTGVKRAAKSQEAINNAYKYLPNRLVLPNSEESPNLQELGDDQGCVWI